MLLLFLLVIYCTCSLNVVAEGQSCFEFYNITCDMDNEAEALLEINDQTFSAQDTCWELELNMPWDTDPFNIDAHPKWFEYIKVGTELCNATAKLYSQCWWCAKNASDTFCLFDSCMLPDVIDPTVNIEETCNLLDELISREEYPATIDSCLDAEQASFYCPEICVFAETYLGADTGAKRKALVWLSRSSAFLAFWGAVYIMWDVLYHRKNRGTVYHQLMFFIAVFDAVTAVAWGFSSAPVTAPFDYVYGSKGTEETCTAQAFFIQLGYTSMFFNVSLSIYYVMVIVLGWNEDGLKKIRWFIYGLPLAVGLALALFAIPHYTVLEYGCHFAAPTSALSDRIHVYLFAVGPVILSISAMSLCMIIVYCKVRRQAAVSRKWSMGVGATNSLETKVFWTCFFYMCAFYLTWPIVLAVYIVALDTRYYGIALVTAFLAPLQGFSNFLVYIRPKLFKSARKLVTQIRSRMSQVGSIIGRTSLSTPSSSALTPSMAERLENSTVEAADPNGAAAAELSPQDVRRESAAPDEAFEDEAGGQLSHLERADSQHTNGSHRGALASTTAWISSLGRKLIVDDDDDLYDPSVLIALKNRPNTDGDPSRSESLEANNHHSPPADLPIVVEEDESAITGREGSIPRLESLGSKARVDSI